MDLSINPNTIQRAYAQLEKEGLIYPVKGKGNFVADTQQIKKKNREDYRRELLETVQKGRSLGFSEEELVAEVEHSYEAVSYTHLKDRPCKRRYQTFFPGIWYYER